jgi:hypothetical protein
VAEFVTRLGSTLALEAGPFRWGFYVNNGELTSEVYRAAERLSTHMSHSSTYVKTFITCQLRMDLAARREYEPIKLRINFTLKHKFMNVLNDIKTQKRRKDAVMKGTFNFTLWTLLEYKYICKTAEMNASISRSFEC